MPLEMLSFALRAPIKSKTNTLEIYVIACDMGRSETKEIAKVAPSGFQIINTKR